MTVRSSYRRGGHRNAHGRRTAGSARRNGRRHSPSGQVARHCRGTNAAGPTTRPRRCSWNRGRSSGRACARPALRRIPGSNGRADPLNRHRRIDRHDPRSRCLSHLRTSRSGHGHRSDTDVPRPAAAPTRDRADDHQSTHCGHDHRSDTDAVRPAPAPTRERGDSRPKTRPGHGHWSDTDVARPLNLADHASKCRRSAAGTTSAAQNRPHHHLSGAAVGHPRCRLCPVRAWRRPPPGQIGTDAPRHRLRCPA